MGQLFVPESLLVTVGPDIFRSEEAVFDLSGPSVVALQATLLTADLDGLEWGMEEGNLTFGLEGPPAQSDDGVTWIDAQTTKQDDYTGVGSLPFALTAGAFVTSRFVRLAVGFFSWPGALDYEGEDHPTATVRIDVRMG